MTQETLKTNQDTNLRTEEHEKLYHEFGYNLPTEEDLRRDIEEDGFNDWVDEAYDYEIFEPTFLDTLRYKTSRMPKWQLVLLWVGIMIVEVGLTMLAVYLSSYFN
jgi:hypothetical protein